MEMPIYLPVGTISMTECVESMPLIFKDRFIKTSVMRYISLHFMDVFKI